MNDISSTLDSDVLGTQSMNTAAEADAKFLRRILFALIFSAVAAGGVTAYASVKADQAGQVNFIMPVLATR